MLLSRSAGVVEEGARFEVRPGGDDADVVCPVAGTAAGLMSVVTETIFFFVPVFLVMMDEVSGCGKGSAVVSVVQLALLATPTQPKVRHAS